MKTSIFKNFLYLSSLPLCLSASYGVTITVSEADFDTTNTLNGGNNGAALTTTDGTAGNTAPAGSTGEVGVIDLGGTNQWGAVNEGSGNTIPLPAGTTAGVDTFSASFRVYIPTGTTLTGTDRISLIIRRNDDNGPGNFSDFSDWGNLALDTWHTLSVPTTTIPEFEDDGTTPVTGMTPILSFRDRVDTGNAEAGAGVALYIDDWTMTMTAVPEPSVGAIALLGLGLLGFRRKR